MKKKLLTLLAISLLTPSLAFAGHPGHEHKKPEIVEQKEAKIIMAHTEGMVCDFCARGIEKLFGKRDEVSSIDVSLENQTVTIYLNDGKDISDEEVIQIIKDNGVTTTRVHRP